MNNKHLFCQINQTISSNNDFSFQVQSLLHFLKFLILKSPNLNLYQNSFARISRLTGTKIDDPKTLIMLGRQGSHRDQDQLLSED